MPADPPAERTGAPSADHSSRQHGAEHAALADRVRAIERAVSDRDDPPSPVPAVADVEAHLATLDDRVSEVEATVAGLEARQAAVEAFVDRVEHVNDAVERRADAALAAVDRLESTVASEDSVGGAPSDRTTRPQQRTARGAHVSDAVAQDAPADAGTGDSTPAEAGSATPGGDERGFLDRLFGP